MKKVFSLLLFVSYFALLNAQEEVLPFAEIPSAPDNYEAQNILARMVDGLGFRYYWATEDLRPEDLLFTPGNDGRNCGHTLDHILGLSAVIVNTAANKSSGSFDWSELTWEEKRALTLNNLKRASDLFRELKSKELQGLEVKFDRNGKKSEYPLWNLMNGPLADAINHVGQIVSFRRSAGNPIPSGVNVFKGTHQHPH